MDLVVKIKKDVHTLLQTLQHFNPKLGTIYEKNHYYFSYFKMARRQRNRVRYDAAQLDAIVSGQRQRTCMDVSKKGYLSKMKVMTAILNEMDDAIREEAFELNEDKTAKMHTGEAENIYMLILPISLNTAMRLFAAIS